MKIENREQVEAYLRTIPADAPLSRRWQACRTAVRALIRSAGLGQHASDWTVEALPPQAYRRYGDCNGVARRIRLDKSFVERWWCSDLSHTIVHEAAHAVAWHEAMRQGKRNVWHGPMWRGVMATMGMPQGRAKNLPKAGGASNHDLAAGGGTA
jgi:hypothetical protein